MVRAAALADLCAHIQSDSKLSVGLKRSYIAKGGMIPLSSLGSASEYPTWYETERVFESRTIITLTLSQFDNGIIKL